MRFLITMNMPSKTGNSVHQIAAEYPVDSIEEFREVLESNDFVEVEEYYRNTLGEYYSSGKVLLNHRYIGKVRQFVRNNMNYSNE